MKSTYETMGANIGRMMIMKLYWSSATKPMPNPMRATHRKLATASKSWRIFYAPFLWTITMPFLTSAAASAPPTNTRHFWMVCNMGHIYRKNSKREHRKWSGPRRTLHFNTRHHLQLEQNN